MKTAERPFTDNFNTLVALVTHLSNTDYESRTVPGIARDLNLAADQVRRVLDEFSAFFRRSQRADEAGDHYYTVHLRYARRAHDQDRVPTERLKPEELATMFDLIATMVKNESQLAELHQRNWTILVTMIAAVIAATASIMAAFIKSS
jgi:hypothetical protein